MYYYLTTYYWKFQAENSLVCEVLRTPNRLYSNAPSYYIPSEYRE